MREKSCFSLINKKASGFIFLPEFINIKLILLKGAIILWNFLNI